MKKKFWGSVIFFSFIFCSCSDNNITEAYLENGLNFYLLKDSTITAGQASNIDINDLNLAEKPFLTYKDLIHYNWKEHSFGIDSNKAKIIRNICANNITVFGIPFVVTVDQERIYLGAFWFAFSSIAPTFPHINTTFAELSRVLAIEKSWDSTKPDLRNDKRIYDTLIEYGLLLR
jgi:hypothetical protein